jgi:hypothetical protein
MFLIQERLERAGWSLGDELLNNALGHFFGQKSKNPALGGVLVCHLGSEDLERETRLELATPTLARLCSTN